MVNDKGEHRPGPLKKFIAGAVSAAVWTNKASLKDGRQIESLSVTIDRRFKDSDGEWQSSGSLRLNDLPKAILVLSKAYEYMASPEHDNAEDAGVYA